MEYILPQLSGCTTSPLAGEEVAVAVTAAEPAMGAENGVPMDAMPASSSSVSSKRHSIGLGSVAGGTSSSSSKSILGSATKRSESSSRRSSKSGSGSSSSTSKSVVHRSPFAVRQANSATDSTSTAATAATTTNDDAMVTSPPKLHIASAAKPASSVQVEPMMEATESTTKETMTTVKPATIPAPPPPPPAIVYEYPQQIPLPSRELVQQLYTDALSTASSNGVADDEPPSDQHVLQDAGLLSLEDVILPALASMEERALSTWQKKIQRDAPSYKPVLVAARRAIYQAVHDARSAAQASRLNERAAANAIRHDEWKEQAQQQEQQRLSAEQQAREQRKRAAQKLHVPNQELWREIAHLQTELQQLGLEHDHWRNAERIVESELAATHGTVATNAAEATATSDEMVVDDQHLSKIVQAANDITLSSDRIQRAMDMVRDIVLPRAEHCRRAVYQQYVGENHQFAGYQGVQNAKGLLKLLSQSQPDGDDHDHMEL